MDPNNALCNWIDQSAACDYQRMGYFGNYPNINNNYGCGCNTGVGFMGGIGSFTSNQGSSIFNRVKESYNAETGVYSYSNKPTGLAIGLGAASALGNILGAINAGKQAEQYQEQVRENQLLQYMAYKQQSEQAYSAQQTQQMFQMMMMMPLFEKMMEQNTD